MHAYFTLSLYSLAGILVIFWSWGPKDITLLQVKLDIRILFHEVGLHVHPHDKQLLYKHKTATTGALN